MKLLDNWKEKAKEFAEKHAPTVENKVKVAISKAMEPTTQRWLRIGSFAITGIALFGSLKGVSASELIFEAPKASTDAISIVIDHF